MTDKEYAEFIERASCDEAISVLSAIGFGIFLFIQIGIIMMTGFMPSPTQILSTVAIELVIFFVGFGWAMNRYR